MIAQFFPVTDLDLSIGGPNGRLFVGDSFDRGPYEFLTPADPVEGETCKLEPVDFTGFTLVAEILDSANIVLDTFTVTPSVGDATGAFVLHLDDTQTTTTLRDSAVNWRLRITDGTPVANHPLIFTSFQVT